MIYRKKCDIGHLYCLYGKWNDIREAVKSILEKPEMVDHAIMLGRKLSKAGGIQTLIKGIKELEIR